MATSAIKPKRSEFLPRCIDFVFGFENRKGEVLDSWIVPADGFNCSSEEFYAAIEQRLIARKIPSLKIKREEFFEGGLLSDKRTYLRLMRERLAIVTCAAPFGDIFFFSCRTVYIPALVRLWHILVAILFFSTIGLLLVKLLGVTFACIALITLLIACAAMFRNGSEAGFSDLDSILLRVPVVSTIYQDWFREETYYREDTRNLYLKVLPELIRELAENLCAAKGVKLQKQLQPMQSNTDLSKSLRPERPIE